MSNNINPCPLCGRKVVLESFQVRKGWEASIHCECLLSMSTITCDTKEEAEYLAISAWNSQVEKEKISPNTCPMCLDCPDNCQLEGKVPMTREQVRAETAKEFAEKIAIEFKKYQALDYPYCYLYETEQRDELFLRHIEKTAASFGAEVKDV